MTADCLSLLCYSVELPKKGPLEPVRPREEIHYTISHCWSWPMGFDHVNFGVAQMQIMLKQRDGCVFSHVFIARKYQKKKFGLRFDLLSLKLISPWSSLALEIDAPKGWTGWMQHHDWLWLVLPSCFFNCLQLNCIDWKTPGFTWRLHCCDVSHVESIFQNFKTLFCTTGPTSSAYNFIYITLKVHIWTSEIPYTQPFLLPPGSPVSLHSQKRAHWSDGDL